jgi:hypothetical protein
MATIVHPLPRERRHPADYRDAIEHEEVAQILSELEENHPARDAYCSARLSDSIALTRLLAGRVITTLLPPSLLRVPSILQRT